MGLKWEVTPSLPQEPHYFSGGSSQKALVDAEVKDDGRSKNKFSK